MTHTIIGTNSLDACIHICAPSPLLPVAHTHCGIGIHTPQHTTYDVKLGAQSATLRVGRVGMGAKETAHIHPLCVVS